MVTQLITSTAHIFRYLSFKPSKPSGSLNIQQSYILPTECTLFVFVRISEQTAIIPLRLMTSLVYTRQCSLRGTK